MLTVERMDETMIRLELSGQLDATEMEVALDRLIDETKDMKDGKLLYVIDDFEIPTLGAMMVEMKKLPALFSMIGRISKAAVCADEAWIRTVAEWEGVLFPGLEIKGFEENAEEEAKAWLMA